jgi:hypothetical protein
MKKIFVLLFLVISLNGFGQSRIGSLISKVRDEYSNPKYQLRQVRSDSTTFLAIQYEYATIIHRFGRDSICNKTYVTVPDTMLANEIARTCDAIYEPKSYMEWTVILPNDVLNIELVATATKDGAKIPTFQWTRAKKTP